MSSIDKPPPTLHDTLLNDPVRVHFNSIVVTTGRDPVQPRIERECVKVTCHDEQQGTRATCKNTRLCQVSSANGTLITVTNHNVAKYQTADQVPQAKKHVQYN